MHDGLYIEASWNSMLNFIGFPTQCWHSAGGIWSVAHDPSAVAKAVWMSAAPAANEHEHAANAKTRDPVQTLPVF